MHALATILALLNGTNGHQLRWSTQSALGCPSHQDLETALAARFEPGAIAQGVPATDEVGLSVSGTDVQIVVTLRDGAEGVLTQRTVARSAGSCAELAQTIALLAEAWLVQLPWHGEGVVRVASATPTAMKPVGQADASASAPSSPTPTPASASTPTTPIATFSVTPATTAEAPSHPRLWTFDLRASGGAFLFAGDDTSGGAEGGLALELALPIHLALGIEASLDSDVTVTDPQFSGAQLTVHSQRLAAFVGYRLTSWLEVLAGAELTRFGETTNYAGSSSNLQGTALGAGGWAAVIASLDLFGPLRVFGESRLTVEQNQIFTAADLGASSENVLSLSPVFLQISAGLELRL